MAVARSTGASRPTTRRRPSRNPIPVAPSGPRPISGSIPTGTSTAASGSSSGSSTRDSRDGGGKKPTDPYAAYQKKQEKAQREAEAKAAQRYMRQVRNLDSQADALKRALRIDFKRGLRQQIADIEQILRQQQQVIRQGYRDRLGELEESAEDNEKAAAAQTGINDANRLRERNNAVAEATHLGAGESDMLQAQMMSLRNWQANQTEITRGYFDTLQSINSSLTDLNVDTKTALVNNAIQANADKEQLWTQYYDQRSEAFTQLGNIRGQQADYLVSAAEMGREGAFGGGGGKQEAKSAGGRAEAGKGGRRQQRDGGGGGRISNAIEARNSSRRAFMNASKMQGKSWDNPGVSKTLMKWDGAEDFEERNINDSRIQNARTIEMAEGPEGATLRRW